MRRDLESPAGMDDAEAFYHGVEALCLDRLNDAHDPASGLFSRQLRNGRWEPTLGTETMTGTAICLIGLARAGVEPKRINIDVRRTMDAVVGVGRERRYRGGTGLVIWANAVSNVYPLPEALDRLGILLNDTQAHLERITTMEVAWLASGLAHEIKRRPSEESRAALEIVASGLLNRFDRETRLFHHSSAKAPLRDRLRRHLPNFADQIYPVLALSHAAVAIGLPGALEAAAACAAKLVELQGDLGQWWWHYNSKTGSVAGHYPVYSVHQHAMAPMALMTLTAAGGQSFTAVIGQSLAWVKTNELGIDLLDTEAGTIWRDVEKRESSAGRVARHAASLLGKEAGSNPPPADRLLLNRETRPYEWAWCLYAGAMARNAQAPEFIS